MELFFLVLFFILGASIGSFITVLIHRTKHYEKGLVSGHSKCVNCKKDLQIRDLVPILSFLFLRGRCRFCGKQIKKSYILIELLSASMFVFLYSQMPFIGFSSGPLTVNYAILGQLLYLLVVFSLLIAIFFYDIMYLEIPDIFSLPLIAIVTIGGTIAALVENTGLQSPTAYEMFIGAIIGFCFFYLQYLVSKGRWLGGGDIRLGLFMGVFLGWKLLFVGLFASYLLGTIISLGLLASRKVDLKTAVPFGPFLIIGTFVAHFYGNQILDWYLGIIL